MIGLDDFDDFADWEDYIPLEEDLSITKKEVVNPNRIKLKLTDTINLLEVDKEWFEEVFDNESTSDMYDEAFINFIKGKNITDNIEEFECAKETDLFLLRKDGQLYLGYVYQMNSSYVDDNKLTFTGWDYNVIVNLDDMTSKTINVR